jgi:rRNA maturation RNase YbeY
MIRFEVYDVDVPNQLGTETKNWIEKVIHSFNKKTGEVFFLFCSDDALLDINKKFLNHNYLTDIITFNRSSNNEVISGECYLSLERISDNSELLKLKFDDELHRVLIHGVLHLIGYNDKTDTDEALMRSLEQNCLDLR